jgi:hypothetical protein
MKYSLKKWLLFTPALIFAVGVGISGTVAAQPVPGVCGAMDLVFVVDDTGSMGGAIANIQADLVTIIADANIASGGDLNLALTSFKDAPQTDADLVSSEAVVTAAIGALVASGGARGPEASDVSLDAVVNGLGVDGDGVACGAFFSNGNFRAGAVKIAIMLTDNFPGGCSDSFTAADTANAARVANDASVANIRISALYNSSFPNATIVGIMNNYATTTGGQYVNTPSNGAGTAAAISEIIADCGSSANECPLSQGFWKNHVESWPVVDGLEIGGEDYNNAALLDILNTPPKKGNSNLILGHQLIATLLNFANGSDASVISDEVDAAQLFLTGEILPSDFQKDKDMNAVAGILDDYNNRLLTPDCEEFSED